MVQKQLEENALGDCPSTPTEAECDQKPKLPNEILESVLEILKMEEDYKALTSLARANRNFYNLVVPKIYETVVITARNSNIVGFGHGHGDEDGSLAVDQTTGSRRMTRKDVATTFTRHLVFDHAPKTATPNTYQAVKDVVITQGCLSAASYCLRDYCRLARCSNRAPVSRPNSLYNIFEMCLGALVGDRSIAKTLHVRIHMPIPADEEVIMQALLNMKSFPITYEFFDVNLVSPRDSLAEMYRRQAVVHFAPYTPFGYCFVASETESVVWMIHKAIAAGRGEEQHGQVGGRIFLSGVPQLLLTPEEYISAQDVNEAAMIMIYKDITRRGYMGALSFDEGLDYLKRRVRLVEAGFKPTSADMLDTPARRRLFHFRDTVPLDNDDRSSTQRDGSVSDDGPSGSESEK